MADQPFTRTGQAREAVTMILEEPPAQAPSRKKETPKPEVKEEPTNGKSISTAPHSDSGQT
jgi:hypothetical protein